MSSIQRNIVVTLILALAIAAMVGPAASAGVTLNNIQFSTGYLNGTVTNNGADEGVMTGQLTANGGLPLYCVDLYHNVYLGGTYTYSTVTALDDRLGWLINQKPLDASQSAGLQLAVWELTYEHTAFNPNLLSTGNFTASGFDSGVITLADTYLADSVGQHAKYYKYTNGTNSAQELVSPTPEPSSLLALSMGLFGIVGVAVRKRH